MARRKDHTRAQLRDMIIAEGHRHMEDVGYARFSAREISRRIGYSFGTLHNVMGGQDDLIVAINTRTFVKWTAHLERALSRAPDDRIAALVQAYFSFAVANRNLWSAIYEHSLPVGYSIPDDQAVTRGMLMTIVVTEVQRALSAERHDVAHQLARSLLAVVHGHCHLMMSGSLELLGEENPEAAALARVRDSLEIAAFQHHSLLKK